MEPTIAATILLASIEANEKSDCWLWTGYTVGGYGRISIEGKQLLAHRVSYQLFIGHIPEGLHVLHKCDIKRCINPNHLYAGTDADNARDYWERRTTPHYNTVKTMCNNGHPFTPENTHIRPNGDRTCKTCKRLWLQNKRRLDKLFI